MAVARSSPSVQPSLTVVRASLPPLVHFAYTDDAAHEDLLTVTYLRPGKPGPLAVTARARELKREGRDVILVRPFTEADPRRPLDPYGVSKAEAEVALLELAAVSGLEVTIVGSMSAALQEEIGEVLVGLSPIEIVEKRNSEAACRGCHSIIDPIGVGFSQYDSLGRFDAAHDIFAEALAPLPLPLAAGFLPAGLGGVALLAGVLLTWVSSRWQLYLL